ncbi:MAG TPA: hypothetical protein PLU53_10065 [Bacteroidia bacterium]|nr:hypothetical protein [Bacteroidia bacterium]
MNKKIFLGSLFGAAAYLIQGWLVWSSPYKDLASQYFNPASAKQEDMGLMMAGSLIIGFLYTYILSNWKGIITFKTGAFTGAVIFLLTGLAYDVFTYATTTLFNSIAFLWVSAAASIVAGVSVGGVVGWWLGRKI